MVVKFTSLFPFIYAQSSIRLIPKVADLSRVRFEILSPDEESSERVFFENETFNKSTETHLTQTTHHYPLERPLRKGGALIIITFGACMII